MQSLPEDLRELGMTKIVAVDVLTKDDLAIAILATDRGGGPLPLRMRRTSSSLHGERSPDQDEGRL
jgi:hypothetical protein